MHDDETHDAGTRFTVRKSQGRKRGAADVELLPNLHYKSYYSTLARSDAKANLSTSFLS